MNWLILKAGRITAESLEQFFKKEQKEKFTLEECEQFIRSVDPAVHWLIDLLFYLFNEQYGLLYNWLIVLLRFCLKGNWLIDLSDTIDLLFA